MPAKSAKQYRLMAAEAHGAGYGKVPPKVAEEFVHATPPAKRKAWSRKDGSHVAKRFGR